MLPVLSTLPTKGPASLASSRPQPMDGSVRTPSHMLCTLIEQIFMKEKSPGYDIICHSKFLEGLEN